MDRRTVRAAARWGRLGVLQWLLVEGYDIWNEDICWSAAQGGHLHVLKWAREHGCPWGIDLCAEAADNGHLDVLEWARAHGCPWDGETRRYAQSYSQMNQGAPELLAWVISHECPVEITRIERKEDDYSVLIRPGHRD